MKNVSSYNKELRIADAQFRDVFNNVIIYRFDKNDSITNTITVPCLYGSKSIALKSILNPNKSITLPLIAFNRTGFVVDPDRLYNIHRELELMQDGIRDYTLNQPIPIDINFEFNVFTMYPSDDDQIIQNFIPFSMPNFYVAWKHPYTNETLKSQVIWDGQISTEYPIEYDVSTKPRIISTTSFVYKTWIFPGNALGIGQSNGRQDRSDIINIIHTTTYAVNDPESFYDLLEENI